MQLRMRACGAMSACGASGVQAPVHIGKPAKLTPSGHVLSFRLLLVVTLRPVHAYSSPSHVHDVLIMLVRVRFKTSGMHAPEVRKTASRNSFRSQQQCYINVFPGEWPNHPSPRQATGPTTKKSLDLVGTIARKSEGGMR